MIGDTRHIIKIIIILFIYFLVLLLSFAHIDRICVSCMQNIFYGFKKQLGFHISLGFWGSVLVNQPTVFSGEWGVSKGIVCG